MSPLSQRRMGQYVTNSANKRNYKESVLATSSDRARPSLRRLLGSALQFVVSRCPKTTRFHVQDVCDVLDALGESAEIHGQYTKTRSGDS
eukprot:823664-Pleurochrysis_carterae.AAC.1